MAAAAPATRETPAVAKPVATAAADAAAACPLNAAVSKVMTAIRAVTPA